jgi:hypothetical protein
LSLRHGRVAAGIQPRLDDTRLALTGILALWPDSLATPLPA